MRPIFQNPNKTLIGYHEAFDASWTKARLGLDVTSPRHDVQMLYHTLNTTATHKKQSLEILSWLYTDMHDFKAATKPYFAKKKFVSCPTNVLGARNCADADATLRLFNRFYPKVMSGPTASHYNVLLKHLVPAATTLHINGAGVGLDRLRQMGERLKEASEELVTQFCSEIGVPRFNLRSTKKLGWALYEHLKLPIIERSAKTGQPSTTEYVLEELSKQQPVLKALMEYKKLQKLLGTYVLGLRGCVLFGNSKKRKPDVWSVEAALLENYNTDGRAHPNFSVVGTKTGRPSVSHPNIANQPRPTDQQRRLGVVLRQAFVAPEGSNILEGDESQAELRVLAALSGDQALKTAINSKAGVHRITAAGFDHIPYDKIMELVTEDMKSRAKTIVFAIVYGGTEFTIEAQIPDKLDEELRRRHRASLIRTGLTDEALEKGCTTYAPEREERMELAREYIDSWRAQYHRAGSYLESIKELVHQNGYVKTVFGRVFHFPLIFSSNYGVRASCEREAVNSVMQSPASDITFMAGIRIQKEIVQRGLKSLWINMVYDANFYEVPDKELEEMKILVKTEMERPVEGLDINFVTELEVGRCWKEDKEDRELSEVLTTDKIVEIEDSEGDEDAQEE